MKMNVLKLGLGMVLVLLATIAGVRADGFTYATNSGAITITGYTGPGGDVVIPGTINGLPVTAIGDSAFSYCSGVTNLFIPASVTSIGFQAFVYCYDLAAIEVVGENPVFSSLDGVLFDAARRTLLRYPEGRTGTYAVPEGVEHIADKAFYYCLNNLIAVALPASVVSIGNEAFGMCFALAEANLSTNVASIGQGAFFHCGSLPDIILPNSVTNLGDGAFMHCSSLTNAVLSGGLASIGVQMFHSCSSLEQIDIPPSVTSIGQGAFAWCGLKDIGLPDGLTAISDSVFYACIALTNAVIPDGVASIGASAFGLCGGLTSVAIPGSVSSIGDAAFSTCQNLVDVTISNGISSIGYAAFSSCESLATITIPGTVSSIGDYAFHLCVGLESIVVDGSNSTFSSHGGVLFDKAQVELILCPEGRAGGYAIPSGVETIRDYAFANCTLLAEVEIPDSVATLGMGAFGGCSSLTNAAIGGGIARIGNSAFSACSSLASIVVPDTVSSIGDAAFDSCTALTNLVLGSGVSHIENRAFSGCAALVELDLPESVVFIGDQAFYGCAGLASIAIPNGVTSIGYELFSGCSSLSSIALPAHLETIGSWAFSECASLASLVLPASLNSMGDYVFAYCTALQDLYFLGNAPSVGVEPFYYAADTTTIHYQEGTTGWKATFGGQPTEVWFPESLFSSVTIWRSLEADGPALFEVDVSAPTGKTITVTVPTEPATVYDVTEDEAGEYEYFDNTVVELDAMYPQGDYVLRLYADAGKTTVEETLTVSFGTGDPLLFPEVYPAITQPVPSGGQVHAVPEQTYTWDSYSGTTGTATHMYLEITGTGESDEDIAAYDAEIDGICSFTPPPVPVGEYDLELSFFFRQSGQTAGGTLIECANERCARYALTVANPVAAMRQDGFEAPDIDPYWVESLQNGTIAPSTAQAHGGTQSMRFYAPSGGQKYLHLRHYFDQPQWGTVTVWVYDSMEYIYFNVNLEDSLSGTTPVSIGVQDWDTSAYYFNHSMTNWAGGKSSVPRVGGWRKFTLRNVESELVLLVDGQELYRGPSEMPFDTIRLTVSGPGGGTIYFDDFTFIPDAAGDGDADGLPDAWEARYFGDVESDPQTVCANGINTLLESYTAGLDPTDPQSLFTVGMVGQEILEWSGVTGRVYAVWWSTNLLNGFECLASNLSWSAAAFTDTVHQAETEGFYRLEVRLE
jgi:hypothetical protein